MGIDGMTDGMCEARMNDTVRNNLKVIMVSSSYKDKSAEIIAEGDIPVDELKKIVEQTGFKLVSCDSEPYEKKKGFLFFQ